MMSRSHRYHFKGKPLPTRAGFALKLGRNFLIAGGVVSAALAMGVIGYHFLENQPWLDALLNASMILGGMGPVDPIKTTGGKLFASFYALFSGIIFVTSAAVLVAPMLNRILHRLHIELEDS
jgi:hypothetical protein